MKKLSYTDKNGKVWTPVPGTISAKLKLLCQAGLVVRNDSVYSNGCAYKHTTWYKPQRIEELVKDVD